MKRKAGTAASEIFFSRPAEPLAGALGRSEQPRHRWAVPDLGLSHFVWDLKSKVACRQSPPPQLLD